jgi:5'(3')-deoxyribonucleotidase
MAIVAVDMDEVVADALDELLSRYNALYNTSISKAHLSGCHLRDVIPYEHRHAAEQIVHADDFFADLKVMDGAQEVLKNLSLEHEIFITTAAMEVPKSFTAKYEWLGKYFPFISPMNYVFCGSKHIIAADYLIDDNVRHFKLFKGQGILFDAPHNKQVTGYTRVKDWHDVAHLFAGMSVRR